MPRYYSVEEANAALPGIELLLVKLQESVRQASSIQTELSDLPPTAYQNGAAAQTLRLEQNLTRLVDAAKAIVERLAELGVEVKDPATGLIDFRSWREGRVVYLCWRLGEGDIAFWHELDAGFAGRQPL